jgi:hypothetical protein
MKKNYFVPVIFALFLFVSSPIIGYSLNVHSSNIQKENVPMLSISENTNGIDKNISQINRGQVRSTVVHIRNRIRQFLKMFDIFGLF